MDDYALAIDVGGTFTDIVLLNLNTGNFNLLRPLPLPRPIRRGDSLPASCIFCMRTCVRRRSAAIFPRNHRRHNLDYLVQARARRWECLSRRESQNTSLENRTSTHAWPRLANSQSGLKPGATGASNAFLEIRRDHRIRGGPPSITTLARRRQYARPRANSACRGIKDHCGVPWTHSSETRE